jgi:hypothetical protein
VAYLGGCKVGQVRGITEIEAVEANTFLFIICFGFFYMEVKRLNFILMQTFGTKMKICLPVSQP